MSEIPSFQAEYDQEFLPLPQKARDFIDAQLDEIRRREDGEPDPKWREIFQRLNKLTEEINPPKYTLRSFRDFHKGAFENSVAHLTISNDVLLDIINSDIYFTEELRERLNTKTFTSDNLRSGKGRDDLLEMDSIFESLRKREEWLKLPAYRRVNERFPFQYLNKDWVEKNAPKKPEDLLP